MSICTPPKFDGSVQGATSVVPEEYAIPTPINISLEVPTLQIGDIPSNVDINLGRISMNLMARLPNISLPEPIEAEKPTYELPSLLDISTIEKTIPTYSKEIDLMPSVTPLESPPQLSAIINDISIKNLDIKPVPDIKIEPIYIPIPIVELPQLLTNYVNFTLTLISNAFETEQTTIKQIGSENNNSAIVGEKITNINTVTDSNSSIINHDALNKNQNETTTGNRDRYRTEVSEDIDIDKTISDKHSISKKMTNQNEEQSGVATKFYGNQQILDYKTLYLTQVKSQRLINRYNEILDRYKIIYNLPETTTLTDSTKTSTITNEANRIELVKRNKTLKSIENKLLTEIEKLFSLTLGTTTSIDNLNEYTIKKRIKRGTDIERENTIKDEQVTKETNRNQTKTLSQETDLSSLSTLVTNLINMSQQEAYGDFVLPYVNACCDALASVYEAKAKNYIMQIKILIASSKIVKAVYDRNEIALNLYEKFVSKTLSMTEEANSIGQMIFNKGLDINDKYLSIYSRLVSAIKSLDSINENNMRAYFIGMESYMDGLQALIKMAQNEHLKGKLPMYQAQIDRVIYHDREAQLYAERYNNELTGLIEKTTAEITALQAQIDAFNQLVNLLDDSVQASREMLSVKSKAEYEEGKALLTQIRSDFTMSCARLLDNLASLKGQMEGAYERAIGMAEAAQTTAIGASGQLRGAMRKAIGNVNAARTNATAQVCGVISETIGGMMPK